MGILSNLEPKRVFEIFEEMCAIPHGSTNTKAISDWCVAFGEKLGLEHYQDEANNVILIAPATPGYEDAPAVILQGHVDMVCEKEAGCAKDMDKEGLDLFVDGDLVGAKGTTLGGDDGIAVAMALAALEDTTLQHPRLEVVLTTDEEIGMLGAAVLDVTPLQGRTMLNIDSEEEGIFTVGCAGGSSVFCHLPLIREEFAGETLAVRVSGLVGGHCIGVDPYYLTYRAEQMGYHSQIILSGRRINDDMGKYVAENIVKNLIRADIAVKHAKVAILGFTFKENCPDTRNTKVIDIYKELQDDLGCKIPNNGYLKKWADQGVLLLNTVLTVRAHQANSHQGRGWEQFTDAIIQAVNAQDRPIVYMLWGRPAQSKIPMLTNPKHLILKAPHPSPLSAYRGFFGCRHFSQANQFLKEHGIEPIDWQIEDI